MARAISALRSVGATRDPPTLPGMPDDDKVGPDEKFPPIRISFTCRLVGRDGTVVDCTPDWRDEEIRLDDPELRRVLPDGSTIPARLDQEHQVPPRPQDLRQATFENVAIRAQRAVQGADGSVPDHDTLVMTHDKGPWLEPDERELLVQLLDAAIGAAARRAAEQRRCG